VTNTQYRLSELLNPGEGRGLAMDGSKGLILGALAGPEQFADNPIGLQDP
jgi:hypothetical protein